MKTRTIHEAIGDNDIRAAMKFINEGGSSLLQAENEYGQTPLNKACEDGKLEIVKLLLAAGADVNERGREGWTPLLSAAENTHRPENVAIIRLLLEHGADPNARDEDGESALDIANWPGNQGWDDIVDLFREYAPEMVVEVYCSGCATTIIGDPGRK